MLKFKRKFRRLKVKTKKILPFYSQYIFSLLIYVVDNRHLFIINQDIHNISTRSNLKFHIPSFNLTKFQKEVNYSGNKLFNHHLSHIRSLSDDTKLFRTIFKKFLYSNSFYSIDKYFDFQGD